MKKTYNSPVTNVVVMNSCHRLLSGSVGTNGLDGFDGNGGKGSGKSADARSGFFDDGYDE